MGFDLALVEYCNLRPHLNISSADALFIMKGGSVTDNRQTDRATDRTPSGGRGRTPFQESSVAIPHGWGTALTHTLTDCPLSVAGSVGRDDDNRARECGMKHSTGQSGGGAPY